MNAPKSPRPATELREAALNAGWGDDPLASEILHALASSEQLPAPPAPPTSASSYKTLAIVATVVAIGAIAGLVAQQVNLGREREAHRDELARMKSESDAHLTELTKRMTSAIATAEAAAQANASAADSNKAAVDIYMTKFQELLEETNKLKTSAQTSKPKEK